ncbi:uncharacterized protein LOC110448201 isoform X1 [Mizuhopecten yessoensis]|uniref:uncharacterized protein LOC110448201 isoform X1 n=1 Tax=Mizuhopecten yessoensis TaxID=6573 RepID=UPI000B45B6D8|nr:uncharacterized protein LOC110448201 isoform X1 [Mizuhopecten yessoensis]XP_021350003.1 uncharacterized protein LOC110448201 isoform X1 [Mizuhopecten yessoensis]
MGKMDIKSAFRLLPVIPSDYNLLGFQLGEQYYVDKCLPMGCSISCALFEKISSVLEWLVRERKSAGGLDHKADLDHYLDDFFFAGRADSSACLELMHNFTHVCSEIGVPIAEEKTVLPTPVLIFLGLEIDTNKMEIRIPQDKLASLRELLQEVMGLKKVTLDKLQSLAGLLNFCVRAIPPGRAFIRRFYTAMSGVQRSYHFVRVTNGMKEDIKTWLIFLDLFNGYCSFPDKFWSTSHQLQLYTDSAGGDGSKGGGAYFQDQWVFISWPKKWVSSEVIRDITFLELVPIVLALFIWGPDLKNKKIMLNTDNKGLVAIINKKTSKSCRLMSLLRPFILKCMFFNIQCKAVHIEGASNDIADAISRQQWSRFRMLAPRASLVPAEIPQEFQQLISRLK